MTFLHMNKTRNRNFFLRDVIIMMNKDTLNECREHNKCADVKAYEQQILYGKTAHSLSKVV